jgi:nitroreductase
MQTLGLNTCWVGLTFKNIKDAYILNPGEELKFVIACGYGEDGAVQHPQKKPITHYYSDKRGSSAPLRDWFMRGMEAALLAPTAVNQQKFSFEYVGMKNSRHIVKANKGFSMVGYTNIDLGIAKLHFEICVGKEKFEWL